MRFDGERAVGAPVTQVWRMLHDGEVLRSVVPGCAELRPEGAGAYAAALQARVGPVADTYRGSFTIDDLRPGAQLQVRVDARGRCGRLELTLVVTLADGPGPDSALLRYRADAQVRGLAARLGAPTLGVVGAHFTAGFFGNLDRAVRRGARIVSTPAPAAQPV